MGKKIKKLVLRKETITNLSGFEQSRIKGGVDSWDYINQYVTTMMSHYDPANCINGYNASDRSYCYCTNGQNTCGTSDC
ncbi:MAG: class I lanthipeptide [Prevotellaceae bacterium]|jgi:hypothetical protein|nr:class I lanthipeptide [Prevotellaceae bacterium]